MHGRVKVRSSEEKAAAERKQRAEKVRAYRELTDRIFAKRAANEQDEEALKLTRDVLVENPDIATMWNYRREIVGPGLAALATEDAMKVCDGELSLTQRCLRVNPKSYCAWLHRQWVMEHSPKPDWVNERNLCDLFLQYDERNFHCWDYRRFVTTKAEVPPEEEFSFTYDKIASNFSNYSAWHYRSKLLPLLHPSLEKKGGVAEEALLKEHELAQNAFFTDPSDQSAWFYHRWLLGRSEQPLAIVGVFVRWQPTAEVVVVFNQLLKVVQPIKIVVGGCSVSSSLQSDWPKSLWRCPLPDNVIPSNEEDTSVSVNYDNLSVELTLSRGQREGWTLGEVDQLFGSALTAATSSVLEAELESCQELLQLEPNNKWCILTTLLLMQALDSEKNHQKIRDMFSRLTQVDPYRHGYYQDMLSRSEIEHTIVAMFRAELPLSSSRSLDLSGKGLTRLYHTEHMFFLCSLDLSRNQLLSLQEGENLLCLHTLIMDDNKLEELPLCIGQLQALRVLSIRNNKLSTVRKLRAISGTAVEVLQVKGNPLCGAEGWREEVRTLLPSLQELDQQTLPSNT